LLSARSSAVVTTATVIHLSQNYERVRSSFQPSSSPRREYPQVTGPRLFAGKTSSDGVQQPAAWIAQPPVRLLSAARSPPSPPGPPFLPLRHGKPPPAPLHSLRR